LTLTPITDTAGFTIAYACVFHDVTERSIAEKVLQQAQEELIDNGPVFDQTRAGGKNFRKFQEFDYSGQT
jgi:hypothetical protein